MIYIIIEHINGEIEEIKPKYIRDKKQVKEYIMKGYIVIQINLIDNIVKEIN